METIREAVAVAEPPAVAGNHDVRVGVESSHSQVADPEPREREFALRIRMTASSLAGIALIDRHPDSESTR